MIHILLAVIYLSFISLGLPDALLGAAWPTMYPEFQVPVSWAGAVFVIISAGTVVSSLLSDRLTRKLGVGRVTALSVAMTAAALLGFAGSSAFWMLCLWAIPYGLGAGSVDAALNNYVALHYASRHMSWLHCMWGIGASLGPYIMGYVLAGGRHWGMGYRCIGILQIFLAAALVLSLPLWKRRSDTAEGNTQRKPLSFGQIVAIPGVREIMVTFFCYCALEQTAGLWASSYLVLCKGVDNQTAASFASLFFVGITLGRACNGFLTLKWDDARLIRMGQGIILAGILLLLLPFGECLSLGALVLFGIGCAPIYPCVIHSTPEHFGPERSQAVIGVQMASAYIGNCLMPPLFGMIAEYIHVALLPLYLLMLLVVMAVMHERLLRKCV